MSLYLASIAVGARFHKQVQSDLNKILKDYFDVSEALGDDFYREFMAGVEVASDNPTFFHFDLGGLRRCNLERFPFHFLYDIRDGQPRIWVLRHHSRKSSLGMRRFRR